MLIELALKEEVYSTERRRKSLKAPGLDEFQPFFFK